MAEDAVGVSGDALLAMVDRLGSRMDAGMARIEAKLDHKADKVDLARIETRLDEHGKDISRLKEQIRSQDILNDAVTTQRTAAVDSRQRRINLVLAAALVVVSLLGVLATVFHW
jgi:hypothetical protein